MSGTLRPHDGPPAVLFAPHAPRVSMRAAVEAGGGRVVTDPADAEALVWLAPRDPDGLGPTLAAGPSIRWVQLPFAGIDPFIGHLTTEHTWTSGKGVYAEPVAEMVLAMLLAQLRHLVGYARATRWSGPVGTNLHGAHVVVLGGGEITRALLPLLAPFHCRVTVVRRRDEPFAGADRTVGLDALGDVAADADAVVVAMALTESTRGAVDARVLAAMPDHALLVNVGRGAHVDTDALTAALAAGTIGGAALDVTDPEPLPEGHPLWSEPRCLITPHVGNTPEMGVPLLEARVRENVRRFATGGPLIGLVDVAAGY